VNKAIAGRLLTAAFSKGGVAWFVLAKYRKRPPTTGHWLRNGASAGWGLRFPTTTPKQVGNASKATAGRLLTATFSKVVVVQIALSKE
jgi:hypothetical protein